MRNQIVEHHQWVAERCARRFADSGEPRQDLLQVALIGVVKAVERFDPDRGYAFASFAMPTAMGELRRYFRDATWRVAVPRRSKDLWAGMNAAVASLYQDLGRPPKVDEVAAKMGVAADTVLETMEAAHCYRPGSLDDSREDGASIHERWGHDDPEFDEVELRAATREALSHLDDRSKRIILWRFYEGLTQSEIGDRLGIGQVQVSRLLRAALQVLREHLDDGVDLAFDDGRARDAGDRAPEPFAAGPSEGSGPPDRRCTPGAADAEDAGLGAGLRG